MITCMWCGRPSYRSFCSRKCYVEAEQQDEIDQRKKDERRKVAEERQKVAEERQKVAEEKRWNSLTPEQQEVEKERWNSLTPEQQQQLEELYRKLEVAERKKVAEEKRWNSLTPEQQQLERQQRQEIDNLKGLGVCVALFLLSLFGGYTEGFDVIIYVSLMLWGFMILAALTAIARTRK